MQDRPGFFHRIGVALSLREPPSLPGYGWSYFDHMVAVYVTLDIPEPRAAAIIEKSSERPFGLTWGDVFLLENIVLSKMTPETLCRNAWMLRERFREIAGADMYNRYLGSGLPEVAADTPEKEATLRADLARLLDFLHWYYALIPLRERRRKQLTISCIKCVFFYTVVLACVLWFFHSMQQDFLAMSACVLFWGTIGGFVSSQQRMQKIPTDGDPLISVFGLESADYYLWLSPLLGAVFAAVMALLFIGGILTGTVFPQFAQPLLNPNALPTGVSLFNRQIALPTGAIEYGKLFTWCFLAGFAERLVPDSLDRLTSKLDMGKTNSPTTTAAPPQGPFSPPPPPAGLAGSPLMQPKSAPAPQKGIDTKTLENALKSGRPDDI